ncbi:hypothetical protein [Lactiplantibacillus paraxiangfangensis]
MTAEAELSKLSKIQESVNPELHIKELISNVDEQVKANLIAQFGITRFLDSFQTGGGVDTIHNVRNNVYSSEKVKQQLENETSGYNKDVARGLHGGSQNYRDINRQQTELQKQHKLKDVNTGKILARNQETDLDHTIATKTIWEDKGRALAGLSADELANTESNLHLTDKSINRSMGAQDKEVYANDLERKKKIWKQQNEVDQQNPNLSDEKKRSKEQNTQNRLEANEQAIKENNQGAKHDIERQVNGYYKSSKFLKGTFTNGAKQGISQAEKAVVGVIIFQVENAISQATLQIIEQWDRYETNKARLKEFIALAKTNLNKIKGHISQIKDTALNGLAGGFVSATTNTIINAFVTTSGNFAKILNDSLTALMQATKIILFPDSTVSMHEKVKQATKLVLTAVMGSTSLILGDVLGKTIGTKVPALAPISDLIGNVTSAIIVGALTALLIYSVDNFGQIVTDVKATFNTLMVGLKVDPQTITDSYQQALSKVDVLYRELLQDIYQRYAETDRLQQLAYDMDLPTANQFENSIKLAQHVDVDEKRILKSRSDISNYFNS